ncbi:MAG TPA: acyl-CoA dehydratase activase [Syntrophales bacterium]|nr:acyl-CoA dehydratase activase [Syntrophales bacterium]
MLTVGIDVGSISTKAALLEDGRFIRGRIAFTGYNAEAAGRRIYEEILRESGLAEDAVGGIVATGYGRKSVSFAGRAVTEILCHAAGARFLDPETRSVVDIGGQDSKAIVLEADGRVKTFAMNDKCAAGTGRFLEVMARALEVDLERFGALSLQAESPARISSLCTVFAESEVISLIARGEQRENIVAGIHESIGSRVSAMARRLGMVPPVMMTGGVARNTGVVQALGKALDLTLRVSPQAQLTGAIGAAVLAARKE